MEQMRLRLEKVVAAAQDLGFVGETAGASDHVRIGMLFADAAAELDASQVADLGSGGGVPGLMLAHHLDGRVVLIESMQSRAEFLLTAIDALLLTDVVVERSRAEDVGRMDRYRHRFDVVTARGFGPAATVAECAAPLLVEGGHLLVSEPPDSDGSRWPDAGLAELDMRLVDVRPGRPALAVIQSLQHCSGRYPRRVGIPRKRPLFSGSLS